MQGIILEGIYGSGKSSIMSKLKLNIERLHGDSCIFYSEVFTQRMKEHLADKTPKTTLMPLETITDQLSSLNNLYNKSLIPNNERHQSLSLSYLLESFHLNTATRHKLLWKDVSQIDEKLSLLNCKIIFLKIPEHHIKNRSIISTKSFRSLKWSEYLEKRYGLDNEVVNTAFIEMQRNMESFLNETKMPVFLINTESMDWDEISKNIIQIWKS